MATKKHEVCVYIYMYTYIYICRYMYIYRYVYTKGPSHGIHIECWEV